MLINEVLGWKVGKDYDSNTGDMLTARTHSVSRLFRRMEWPVFEAIR